MKNKLAISVALALFAGYNLNASEAKKLDTISVVEQSETNFDLQSSKNTQAKSVTEILKQDSSIDVGGGTPNAQRIYLRGIGDGFVNITVDGARQGGKDAFNHRSGTSNIDTEILKSASVNAGVTAADQGAGNLGGNISFETVDAQDLLEDGKNYGAFIKTTLGSIDDSYKNSIALYGKLHDKIGILVYGNKSDSENYKTGRGREVDASAEEVENYLVKFSMIDLNYHSLRVSHEQNTQEGLYFARAGDHGYLDPSATNNPLVPQKVKRQTSILNYGFNPNDIVNLKAKLYQNNQDFERLDNGSKTETDRIGADLRNTFTFGNDTLSNKLTVGVDYEENEGKVKNKITDTTDENLGIYIQNRMSFNKLNLSFGARFDDYEQTIGKKKFSGDEISPNVNAEYFFTDNFSLFAGWGQAINTTNTVSVGFLAEDNKPITFNGSVDGDLKAQKSEKYEVGTTFGFDNLLTDSDSLNFKLTYFNTEIKNPINRNGGGMAPRVDLLNYPNINTEGFETKVRYEMENFRASLSYTHSEAKQDGIKIEGTDKKIASNYGDKITANLNYDVSSNLGFGYQLIGQLKNDNPSSDNANNKSGYVIHNLNATYTPQEFKNLTFGVAINNLLNKDYYAHTSLTNATGEAVGEAGRDVRVSLKYKF